MKRTMMRKAALAFALLAIVLMTACERPQKAGLEQAPPPMGATVPTVGEPVTCTVSAKRALWPVQRGLFGTNMEWFNNGNGLLTAPGQFDSQFLSLAQEEGVSIFRFPGGTLADFYHWRDGIGPVQSRPVRPHYTDPGQSANTFGTPELMWLSYYTKSTPMITVNVGSGTPDEAAAWVAYCNQSSNSLRQADGFPQPFKVGLWEIGNELYLSGTSAEKQVTMTPDKYAQLFLSYASAMRKVDPSIKLLAIGVANSYSVPFGYANWTETLLAKAAPQIDAVAVHNGYFPSLISDPGLSPEDVYRAMWGAPEAIDGSLDNLEALIDKYAQGRDIGIAVTEWGPYFSITLPAWIDHVKTLGSAVYAARAMQVFMSHPKVRLANYMKFTDASFMGWVAYNHQPKVPFYALEMYAKHFGSRLVESDISGPTYNVKGVGFVPDLQNVPELTVLSSLNDAGTKLYVNIVSRSWNTSHSLTLNTPGFTRSGQTASVWYVAAGSALYHNGPDLPSNWPTSYSEPGGTANPGPPLGIGKTSWTYGTPLVVPPHSIVTLEMDGTVQP